VSVIKVIQLLFFSLMLETYLHKRERETEKKRGRKKKFFLLTRENAPAQWEKGKKIKMLRRASSVFLLAFLNLSRDINNQTLLCPSFFFSFCFVLSRENEYRRREKTTRFSEATIYTFP
jgi:hypothetical protein